MAAGDKYINSSRMLLGTKQLLRALIQEDADGNPMMKTNYVPITIPTSSNAIVQAYLDKIGSEGYAYPTQAKVDIYTTAWNYSDAQGLTTEFDMVGLFKAANLNICKIPFMHSGGSSRRFTLNDPTGTDLQFNSAKGLSNESVSGTLSAYVDTNFNPAIDAVKSSQNNVSIGGYLYGRVFESTDVGPNFIGCSKITVPTSRLFLGSNSSNILSRVNSTTTGQKVTADSVTDNCLITGLRNNSANQTQYVNGINTGSLTNTSQPFPSFNEYVLAQNNGGGSVASGCFSDGWVAFFYHGSAAIDQVKLNTFVNLLLL